MIVNHADLQISVWHAAFVMQTQSRAGRVAMLRWTLLSSSADDELCSESSSCTCECAADIYKDGTMLVKTPYSNTYERCMKNAKSNNSQQTRACTSWTSGNIELTALPFMVYFSVDSG